MTKRKPESPVITVTHVKKKDKYPDDLIVDPDTNELVYGLRIEGLVGYQCTDIAIDELRLLTQHYYNAMRNQKTLLTEEQKSTLKMHIMLWFREKIEDGNIYK